MGSSFSKTTTSSSSSSDSSSSSKSNSHNKNSNSSFVDAIKNNVQDEINKRMMIQREIQMAINIARARDTIQIFGSIYLTFVGGISVAKILKKPVVIPNIVGIPIVIGGIMLGNLIDMAYGNKLARVNKEAQHILQNERERVVPFPQAPFSKFYSIDEYDVYYNPATSVGDIFPSNILFTNLRNYNTTTATKGSSSPSSSPSEGGSGSSNSQ